jgi:UDP-N-acetylglucosamine enolpyruvyl transferase
MRSSIMLVPPLLARFGVARLEDNVKGCTLGVREIDPHVEVFQHFGGEVERAEGSLLVRCTGRLRPPTTGSTTHRSPPPRTSCCAPPRPTARRR